MLKKNCYQKNKQEYFGLLELAYSDISNIIPEFPSVYIGNHRSKTWNSEYLIPIDKGDYLIVLNSNMSVFWEGNIPYSYQEFGRESSNKMLSHSLYKKFFIERKFAILVKEGQESI